MRRQDFLADTFKDLKFRVLFPGELVTTQEDVNNFAIKFAEWHLNLSKSDDWEKFDYNTTEKLLEIYKKEKGL